MAGSQRPESGLRAWDGEGVKPRAVGLHTVRETGEVGGHGPVPRTNPQLPLLTTPPPPMPGQATRIKNR